MIRAVKPVVMTACLLLAASAMGAPIQGVSVASVSSEFTAFGWDLGAVHTVDGSGLSGGTHAQLVCPGGTSWQTISQTGTGEIVFDLGTTYDLGTVHVWNLNFYAPYNGRGARDVRISTSLDLLDWNLEGTVQFAMATGLDGDPGFDLDATAWSLARYVRFEILSNFGSDDNAGHVGLSEVQFFRADTGDDPSVPEPWTVSLLGMGLLGLCRLRRRGR